MAALPLRRRRSCPPDRYRSLRWLCARVPAPSSLRERLPSAAARNIATALHTLQARGSPRPVLRTQFQPGPARPGRATRRGRLLVPLSSSRLLVVPRARASQHQRRAGQPSASSDGDGGNANWPSGQGPHPCVIAVATPIALCSYETPCNHHPSRTITSKFVPLSLGNRAAASSSTSSSSSLLDHPAAIALRRGCLLRPVPDGHQSCRNRIGPAGVTQSADRWASPPALVGLRTTQIMTPSTARDEGTASPALPDSNSASCARARPPRSRLARLRAAPAPPCRHPGQSLCWLRLLLQEFHFANCAHRLAANVRR